MSTTKAPQPHVFFNAEALREMDGAAYEARPNETGGLLVGFWDDGMPVVGYAVEVPDPAASPTGWTRHGETAQEELNDLLDALNDPTLGYVGDWHTHTSPIGPSANDIAAIRRASTQYDHPLTLVVARPDGVYDVVMAHRGEVVPGATWSSLHWLRIGDD